MNSDFLYYNDPGNYPGDTLVINDEGKSLKQATERDWLQFSDQSADAMYWPFRYTTTFKFWASFCRKKNVNWAVYLSVENV